MDPERLMTPQLADTPFPEQYPPFYKSGCSYTEIQEKQLKFYGLSYAEWD